MFGETLDRMRIYQPGHRTDNLYLALRTSTTGRKDPRLRQEEDLPTMKHPDLTVDDVLYTVQKGIVPGVGAHVLRRYDEY